MRKLLSRRVIEVGAEDRMADVSLRIAETQASHCVVRERPRGDFVGVVRIREAVTKPSERIFADLISPLPRFQMGKTEATGLAELIVGGQVEDAVLLSGAGKFVGVVTRESVRDWQCAVCERTVETEQQRSLARERLVERMRAKLAGQAGALNHALAQLEEFSYAVSHDLRTPLRAMRGYALALQEDYGEKMDETASEYVRRILRASHQLDRLTIGVLGYNEIARAEVAFKRVNLTALVRAIVRQKQAEFPRAIVSIEGKFGTVDTDRALLARSLNELLSNAAQFVAAGTNPEIKISAEREDSWVKISIEDNGVGIRPEHRARIFQLFEQVEGMDPNGGLGVGLAVVRTALEKIGGEVGVESRLAGNGSRFWIRLPA